MMRRERRRTGHADQRAEIDLMIGDDAVERGEDPRIAEVDVREVYGGLRVQDCGGGLVGRGLPLLECSLGGGILLEKLRLLVIFPSVIDLRRLVGGERRLRLIELRLILVLFDAEQLGSFRYRCAVHVIDRFQIALDARDQSHGVERRGVAGQIDIQSHRLLNRLRHGHFGRRRRHIGVLRRVAGRQHETTDHENNSTRPPYRIVKRRDFSPHRVLPN